MAVAVTALALSWLKGVTFSPLSPNMSEGTVPAYILLLIEDPKALALKQALDIAVLASENQLDLLAGVIESLDAAARVRLKDINFS